ncbi:MAG: hypothetical protein U0414_18800 [Polyangiaceae bacterium]
MQLQPFSARRIRSWALLVVVPVSVLACDIKSDAGSGEGGANSAICAEKCAESSQLASAVCDASAEGCSCVLSTTCDSGLQGGQSNTYRCASNAWVLVERYTGWTDCGGVSASSGSTGSGM